MFYIFYVLFYLFFLLYIFNSTTSTVTTTTTTALQPTTTLRPKRTTSPIPTSANPLLRFYPPDEFDKEDSLEEQFMDDMINDSPLYHYDDGTDKRDAGIPSPWASKAPNQSHIRNGIIFIGLSIAILMQANLQNFRSHTWVHIMGLSEQWPH